MGSVTALKYHVQSVHEGIKFPCDQCEFTACTNSYLKKHKETKHGGTNIYPCDVCGLTVTTSADLKEHKLNEHPGMGLQ